MEDVAGTQKRQISTAYQFIESQLQDARQQLEQKEAALRDYKEQHMGQLPEQVPANLATLQRLQLEHQAISESVRRASDALLLLESAAPAPAAVPATPAPDPLTGMKATLAQLRTRYTEAHPDVKALAAQVERLDAAQRILNRRASRRSTSPRSRSPSESASAAIELETLERSPRGGEQAHRSVPGARRVGAAA